MNVFRRGDDYVLALTYGRDVDWVKNVRAAGGCRLESRRGPVVLRDPVVVNDPSRRLVPWPVRVFMAILDVDDFLRMSPAASR